MRARRTRHRPVRFSDRRRFHEHGRRGLDESPRSGSGQRRRVRRRAGRRLHERSHPLRWRVRRPDPQPVELRRVRERLSHRTSLRRGPVCRAMPQRNHQLQRLVRQPHFERQRLRVMRERLSCRRGVLGRNMRSRHSMLGRHDRLRWPMCRSRLEPNELRRMRKNMSKWPSLRHRPVFGHLPFGDRQLRWLVRHFVDDRQLRQVRNRMSRGRYVHERRLRSHDVDMHGSRHSLPARLLQSLLGQQQLRRVRKPLHGIRRRVVLQRGAVLQRSKAHHLQRAMHGRRIESKQLRRVRDDVSDERSLQQRSVRRRVHGARRQLRRRMRGSHQ